MDILSIILIAIGLAMDCLAVSLTKGLQQARWCMPALLMAVLFGAFQGGMPFIGYYAGTLFVDFFSRFAPYIALVLLTFIGGKMIWESLRTDDNESFSVTTDWRLKTLIVLAIATSIDALATGVIFIPVPHVLWLAIAIIALTSFLFSLMGYLIGVYVGQRFHFNVELLGGIILVTIGLKIFIEGVFL
ncbi:MAG: manganese efflux pump MntP family protein [Paludibacteraceae bacterium]|nr:manganese efflux pump MntP family protein [Paludibacteraceae bacterium]